MQNEQDRIAAVYQMFGELAKGNFSFRIPVSRRGTYLDALATCTNMLAGEYESYFSGQPGVLFQFSEDKQQRDAQLLHQYILLHLEEPLPTIRSLARMFHSNERKIKDGFRELYKTSIYKFYNEQRLKKAQLLVLQTQLPLQEIATSCGFNTYTNFSTAFKKYYGYAPNLLRQK